MRSIGLQIRRYAFAIAALSFALATQTHPVGSGELMTIGSIATLVYLAVFLTQLVRRSHEIAQRNRRARQLLVDAGLED